MSNAMPDPQRKWARRNYEESRLDGLALRERCELETDRDLDKPVEQLVCDVHEETHSNRHPVFNLICAQKRMVSMMARIAKSNDRVAQKMTYLTWAITVMTAALLVFTVLMWKGA
jgi:hypothetical protein